MITQELVKELFTYKNGQLIRTMQVSGSKHQKGHAVGSFTADGYLTVRINGESNYCHRLIFLYHFGYLPKEIDHINGVRNDNRIENLRECTRSQNRYNAKKRSNSSSKYKGVCWGKKKRLWHAYITVNSRLMNLGDFWDEEVASQVVSVERLKHHGAFANYDSEG